MCLILYPDGCVHLSQKEELLYRLISWSFLYSTRLNPFEWEGALLPHSVEWSGCDWLSMMESSLIRGLVSLVTNQSSFWSRRVLQYANQTNMTAFHDSITLIFYLTVTELMQLLLRPDYFNSLLSGCAKISLRSLQLIQNAGNSEPTGTGRRDLISSRASSLELNFKKSPHIQDLGGKKNQAPSYFKDLIPPYYPDRALCSQTGQVTPNHSLVMLL